MFTFREEKNLERERERIRKCQRARSSRSSRTCVPPKSIRISNQTRNLPRIALKRGRTFELSVSHSSNPNARSYTLPISKASSSSASLFSFNCFKVSRIAFLCASNCAFVGPPDVPPVGCCFDAFVFRSVPSLFSFGGAIFVRIRNSISVCNRPLRLRVCIRLRNALAFFFAVALGKIQNLFIGIHARFVHQTLLVWVPQNTNNALQKKKREAVGVGRRREHEYDDE